MNYFLEEIKKTKSKLELLEKFLEENKKIFNSNDIEKKISKEKELKEIFYCGIIEEKSVMFLSFVIKYQEIIKILTKHKNFSKIEIEVSNSFFGDLSIKKNGNELFSIRKNNENYFIIFNNEKVNNFDILAMEKFLINFLNQLSK